MLDRQLLPRHGVSTPAHFYAAALLVKIKVINSAIICNEKDGMDGSPVEGLAWSVAVVVAREAEAGEAVRHEDRSGEGDTEQRIRTRSSSEQCVRTMCRRARTLHRMHSAMDEHGILVNLG